MENIWGEHHGDSLDMAHANTQDKLGRLADYQRRLRQLRSQVSKSGKDQVDPRYVANKLSEFEVDYSEFQPYIGFTFEFWDIEGTATDDGDDLDKIRSRRIHQCLENIQFRMEGVQKAISRIKTEATEHTSQYVYSKLGSSFIWCNLVFIWTVLTRLGQRSGWGLSSLPNVLSIISFGLACLSLGGVFYVIHVVSPSSHKILRWRRSLDFTALAALLIAALSLIISFLAL